MRDIILGAGILGLTCAHYLALKGRSVQVIEAKADIRENPCSWFAGGMIAPWCEAESVPLDQRQSVLDMGATALSYWQDFIPSFKQQGTLVVAHPRDHQELVHFARRSEGYQWLDRTALRELEPEIAPHFAQGLFFAQEGHLDPRACLQDLYQQAQQAGAVFEFNRTISLSQARSLGGTVIDCRGISASEDIAQCAGACLRGIRGEMIVVSAPEVSLSRPIRFMHPRIPLYIVPREDHCFMIGATMIEEEKQDIPQMSVRSALELLSAAYALHPGFGEALIREMSVGWRPAYSDNHPKVLSSETPSLIFVNGAYRHGFLAAPSLAAHCFAELQ